ncbi:unnamed protein product [Adineta steineri]|uniref:Uncharacterized protein n=1 Tax=Adineta steineri TaxID=433720 RepID=A0A815A9N1_9BILA|nr:unnamed protein product [Adineta steineri]CAF4112417.1 unnamed protein product [Adineta steineri]
MSSFENDYDNVIEELTDGREDAEKTIKKMEQEIYTLRTNLNKIISEENTLKLDVGHVEQSLGCCFEKIEPFYNALRSGGSIYSLIASILIDVNGLVQPPFHSLGSEDMNEVANARKVLSKQAAILQNYSQWSYDNLRPFIK